MAIVWTRDSLSGQTLLRGGVRVWPARLDPRRVSSSDIVLSSVSVATLIAFDELEMLKLWKGLYLTMWHSDKPLVQVDLVVSACVYACGESLCFY